MSFPSSGMRSLYRNPIKVSPHAYRIREFLKIEISESFDSVSENLLYLQVHVPAFIVIATAIDTGTTMRDLKGIIICLLFKIRK